MDRQGTNGSYRIMVLKKAFILQLFFTGKLKFDNGRIKFGNLNLILTSDLFFALLFNFFEKLEQSWKIYLISWIAGLIAINRFSKSLGLNTPDKIYNWGMKLGELMGTGSFRTHYYDWKRYTYFEIINDPVLEEFSNIRENYFITGIMAGGGSIVHKQVTQCILLEKRRDTRGKIYYKYLTATEDEFRKRKLWDKVYKLYNLGEIYTIQKKIFDKRNYYSQNREAILNVIKKYL